MDVRKESAPIAELSDTDLEKVLGGSDDRQDPGRCGHRDSRGHQGYHGHEDPHHRRDPHYGLFSHLLPRF